MFYPKCTNTMYYIIIYSFFFEVDTERRVLDVVDTDSFRLALEQGRLLLYNTTSAK